GGAISTNAGGTAVLRYGTMRDLVLGLEVVLADGTIYSHLKRLRKDNAGYNLNHYFIGAEGTLGIVTAAVLKLYPAPRQSVTAIAAIPDATAALTLLHQFKTSCGEHLTAFELMSHGALELVTKHIPDTRLPCATAAPYYMLIELTCASPNIPLRTLFETIAASTLNDGTMLDAVLAESGTQAKQFWALRENIPPALRQEGRSIHFDISLPLDQIADFLAETAHKITRVAAGVTIIPFGHIGDGNLHYNMYLPHDLSADTQRTHKQAIQDIVYHDVTARQGSISAEHSIGIERKQELTAHRAASDILLMRHIKNTLDPENIFSPGRIFD
ncbi:MAG: FAD-binding oxidoreductase, partial [Hyphomicrobium sp.]